MEINGNQCKINENQCKIHKNHKKIIKNAKSMQIIGKHWESMRINTTTLEINEGNGSLILQIEPKGLLQENMYVLGKIYLESFNGEHWEFDVEIQAKSENSIPIIGDQALVFSIFFFLFSGWFATSIVSRKPPETTDTEFSVQSMDEFLPGDHR